MSEEIKIKGIVKAVKKDLTGFLLWEKEGQENWYKGIGKVLEYIKPELKGKEIEITLINQEHHTFSYLRILKDTNGQMEKKEDYWAKREDREEIKSRQIGRIAALNSAIEIMKVSQCQIHTPSDILSQAQILAQNILKWVQE